MLDEVIRSKKSEAKRALARLEHTAHNLLHSCTGNEILLLLSQTDFLLDWKANKDDNHSILKRTLRALAPALQQSLRLHPFPRKVFGEVDVPDAQPMRSMAISVLLCRILRSVHSVAEVERDLTDSIPLAIQVFLHDRKSDETLRLLSMSCCIYLARKVMRADCIGDLSAAVSTLLSPVAADVPFDVQVDAAKAIAAATHLASEEVSKRIGLKSEALVRILCTASITDRESFVCLADLTKLRCFCSLVTKQRMLDAAVRHQLNEVSSASRGKAAELVNLIYQDLDSGRLLVVLTDVANAAKSESNKSVQSAMISVLEAIVTKSIRRSARQTQIIDAFLEIAEGGRSSDENSIKASIAFLKCADFSPDNFDLLLPVVRFTTSPFAIIRRSALDVLKEITFWYPDSARYLFAFTCCLESFSLIISHGSDKDSCAVLAICKQLTFEKSNRLSLSGNDALLASLFGVVTHEPVSELKLFSEATEIILTLMEDNLSAFLAVKSVLPWLVKMANRTSDAAMKLRLVAIIVRLSRDMIG